MVLGFHGFRASWLLIFGFGAAWEFRLMAFGGSVWAGRELGFLNLNLGLKFLSGRQGDFWEGFRRVFGGSAPGGKVC